LLAALMIVLMIEELRSQTAQSKLWLHAISVAHAYSMVVRGAHALLVRCLCVACALLVTPRFSRLPALALTAD
jgi:predicted branched-subunit amino acid permease